MGGAGGQQDRRGAAQVPRSHGRGDTPRRGPGRPDGDDLRSRRYPATLDDASAAFRAVLNRIPELSEMVTAVWRLAGELRKTQRRVKALQYIFIPEYEATVLIIKAALDEREREETFRLKWLKTKMTREAAEEAASVEA